MTSFDLLAIAFSPWTRNELCNFNNLSRKGFETFCERYFQHGDAPKM